MKALCVFCGASLSSEQTFNFAAEELGQKLADRKITLVYGGASVGLMGAVANASLKNGGKVIGVIPRFLNHKEVAHQGLSELIVCESMHERKEKMFSISEGFLALPGGFGTLEEIIEILTWRQLGLHHHPIGFLNVGDFYDHLQALFGVMESKKLLSRESQNTPFFATSVDDAFTQMFRTP